MHLLKSLQHPLIKHLVKLRMNSDYRWDHGTVLIEGIKPVREIGSEFPLKTMIVQEGTPVPQDVQAKEIVWVTEDVMQKISGMRSPEGIVAEVPMPPQASLVDATKIIALDGVSDPGNLGTLLRTALALGWNGCFIIENSCDLYNDKALRAARGATFRLPIRIGSWDSLQTLAEEQRWQCLAADIEGCSPAQVSSAKKRLLVFGNEAHGISDKGASLCEKVTIPMPGQMESLNVSVAGGILMYLLANPNN